MSFAATPLDQNRRVDRNTFFNKQAQNQQARLVPPSYSFGAPSVETRSPPKVIPHTIEDPDEPALVRFAKRKQQSAAQNIDPQRWNVKDTSVQIANAFQQAATTENPMPPPVPINPNDAWVTGATRRTNLPRSTSVEYEKETQSTATRRLNPPPANRHPSRRPISKTGSTNLVPDSEDESVPPTYTRGKSPFEHVADTVRSLVNPVVSIHMKARSPEREQSMASYDYASEEREYHNQPATPQQPQRKAPAPKRNRISSDNKAYKPTASDLEASDDDFVDGDRKRRRKKKRNDSVGGPLTTLPVAGYDKKRRRKKNAKGEYVEEEDDGSETDEQSKVSEHRAASVIRDSAPPTRLSHPPEHQSYPEPSLEMAENGLASIPEIEEPFETEVDSDVPYPEASAPSFSIGGFLGKLVNVILRSIVGIASSALSVLGYISWASSQVIGTVLDGPKTLWKNNSGVLVSLMVLALAVYSLRQSSTTVSWVSPSKPTDYTPPETPATDITELAARLQTLERVLYESTSDSRHSHRRIENDLTRSVSDFVDKLSALDRRLTSDVSRISEADSRNRQITDKGINTLKKVVEDLHRKIQDGTLPGKKSGKDEENSKELEKLEKDQEDLKAQLKAFEEKIGTIEGDVKEALEQGRSVPKIGTGNAPSWWNKISGKSSSAVTIKSTDGQDVTALIHQMVDSITSNWSKDILARPDFALHSAGAQVIPSLTSATYGISPEGVVGKAIGFVTGSGYATGLSPINALHPQNYAGRCWPFHGSEGQLGVKLSRRAYISDVTIDHVAKEVAFDLRSTPRQMEVWGLVEGQENLVKVAGWLADRRRRRSDAFDSGLAIDPKDEEWEVPTHLPKDTQYIRITKFLYDVHSTRNVQTFPVDSEVRALGVDFGVVVLVVKNNWGRPEYTCLYRFRVHGDMIEDTLPLYEPSSEEQINDPSS